MDTPRSTDIRELMELLREKEILYFSKHSKIPLPPSGRVKYPKPFFSSGYCWSGPEEEKKDEETGSTQSE